MTSPQPTQPHIDHQIVSEGNGASAALGVIGAVLLLLGVLALFSTGNIFVGILAGTLMAGGCAFLAGYLVVRAVRVELRRRGGLSQVPGGA